MAKGDKVEIILQVGEKAEKYIAEATANGEKVEVDRPKNSGTVEVVVMNRNDKPRQTWTFRSDAVLAVVEKPVP